MHQQPALTHTHTLAAPPPHPLLPGRVILDEAQCIKNQRTLCAHAAWQLDAVHRWCLTGTPLQNSLEDLYTYFRFLVRPPPAFLPFSRPPACAHALAGSRAP